MIQVSISLDLKDPTINSDAKAVLTALQEDIDDFDLTPAGNPVIHAVVIELKRVLGKL